MKPLYKIKLNEISQLIADKTLETKNNALFSLDTLGDVCLVKDKKLVEQKLEFLWNNINHIKSTTFCNGFSGLGWFLQFLISKELIEKNEVSELLLQIDEISYNSALNFIKKDNHDFLHGAIGNLGFLSNRVVENKAISNYLTEIVLELSKISKRNKKGIFWDENYSNENEETESKIINLSLSHGLSSKIVVFAKLYEKNIEKPLIKELIEGSVNFMLNSKNKSSSISVFPSIITDNNDDYSRLSWCYGDLGISIALWQAGEALANETIKQEAIDICLHTTKRKSKEETGIVDAGLCHGTSGVAHIYNRMYRYTGRQEFKTAANYWIEETLKMATFEDGLAGFKAWDGKKYVNEYGLLEGIAGIGLALLAHISDEEPTWDRCLLLS